MPSPWLTKSSGRSANHQQILETPVFKIGEKSTGGVIEYPDSSLFGHILEGPVAPVPVKAIRKSGRLTA